MTTFFPGAYRLIAVNPNRYTWEYTPTGLFRLHLAELGRVPYSGLTAYTWESEALYLGDPIQGRAHSGEQAAIAATNRALATASNPAHRTRKAQL